MTFVRRIGNPPDAPKAQIAGALGLNRDKWSSGWRRLIFPSVFTIYLLQTAAGVVKHTNGAGTMLGIAVLIVFLAAYMACMAAGWSQRYRQFWQLYALMCVLVPIEAIFAHEDAFVMLVYVAVMTIAALFGRAVPILVGFIAIAVWVPPLVRPWHAPANVGLGATILTVGLAMFGFFGIIRANRELEAARTEVARLAAENERSRIARDLHDLLGHSLTTITVKAGLAHRLTTVDPARAATEIAEVERLSRQTLADVRSAVSGYREVTLGNELAAAREVLRAAGIAAELPRAIDSVDEADAALFGWVVREGITNVVRHSRAQNCQVSLGQHYIEIRDDGVGPVNTNPGNGLTGLRERVETAGGRLIVGAAEAGNGWRLRVEAGAR